MSRELEHNLHKRKGRAPYPSIEIIQRYPEALPIIKDILISKSKDALPVIVSDADGVRTVTPLRLERKPNLFEKLARVYPFYVHLSETEKVTIKNKGDIFSELEVSFWKV